MSDGPENSRGRWWEIPGQGRPDDEGHRELMTDSRGRSRPERSLSAGADLADESRHPARAFLWPIVSLVAAAGLLLSVIYVVRSGNPTSSASALPREPTVSGSAQSGGGAKPDPAVSAGAPAHSDGGLVANGGGSRTVYVMPGPPKGQPGAPGVSADTPGRQVGTPSGPVGAPNGSPGGGGGDTGNQPAGTLSSGTTAAPQEPQFTTEGAAPNAPGPQRGGKPVGGTATNGCEPSGSYYECTIARRAPDYLPGRKDRNGFLDPGQALFVCQSDGSQYSLDNRVNHWWAWLWVPYTKLVVWIPVVFLEGEPANAPEPGLPECDRAPTPTTTSSAPPTSSTPAPTSTPAASPSPSVEPTTTKRPSG
ncbi:MAG: hypothetical protein ACRDRW_18370 [Pseudonocardiaceae bacterium]